MINVQRSSGAKIAPLDRTKSVRDADSESSVRSSGGWPNPELVPSPGKEASQTRTFEDLHDAFAQDLRRFVNRRVRDPELTRDIVQETFLRAYRARQRLENRATDWPWLATIARNLIYNARRDERHHRVHVNPHSDWQQVARSADPRSEIDPEKSFHLAQRRAMIRAALSSLRPRQRRVLLLRVVHDLSYEEIATVEEMSSDAVKSLIKRARQAFRDSYGSLERDAG